MLEAGSFCFCRREKREGLVRFGGAGMDRAADREAGELSENGTRMMAAEEARSSCVVTIKSKR